MQKTKKECLHLIPYLREAVGSYAENQRISAVRKVYQRGVTNPMIHIEILWKEYCAYENVSVLLVTKLQTSLQAFVSCANYSYCQWMRCFCCNCGYVLEFWLKPPVHTP